MMLSTLHTPVSSSRRSAQGGGFLLEALVAILVFSFGILGIVGLQAQSMRHVNDAQFRAEAVYYANSVVSRMWGDDISAITTTFAMPSGAGYLAFKNDVQALPGAALKDPEINFDPTAPSTQGQTVTVIVYWQEPGEAQFHNYTTTAVVGGNVIAP